MTILQGVNISKTFGGLCAVDNVSFELKADEILGLIGPNGAGKTTLINLISGFHSPDNGKILFREQDLTGLKPSTVNKKGISRTFQIIRIFPKLTALDNVKSALVDRKTRNALRVAFDSLKKSEKNLATGQKGDLKAGELLDFVGLYDYRYELAENLPYAYCKRLEISRSLATQPEVLLLDEPSSGLNPKEQNDQISIIRKIHEQGIAILIIEHVMKVIMDISHRVMVLHYGKKIADGIPKEIYSNEKVVEAYLGGEAGAEH